MDKIQRKMENAFDFVKWLEYYSDYIVIEYNTSNDVDMEDVFYAYKVYLLENSKDE